MKLLILINKLILGLVKVVKIVTTAILSLKILLTLANNKELVLKIYVLKIIVS